jgi:hypothetical protein
MVSTQPRNQTQYIMNINQDSYEKYMEESVPEDFQTSDIFHIRIC